jgi:DNA-binding XRE family transcriptional regulator
MQATRGHEVTLEELDKEKQALIEANPELAQFSEEWEQEYQIRKKLREAREAEGINQKVLGMLSGLDHRAISRVETNTNISPNLRTIVKYLNAIGYELDIRKVAT